jgi:hypothetical protein
MKGLLALTIFLLTPCYSFAQNPFYIQKGNGITKIENTNPSQIKAKEWQVRLYKKGVTKTGNSYWGTIKGKTASEVMIKLKSNQDFELRFNTFIGKGNVQDDVFTNFNPLGPIAIIDESLIEKSPNKDSFEKLTELTGMAKEHFSTYSEVKNKLDVILKGKPTNAFDNVGYVFREYTSNLKDAFLQINSLRKLLENNISVSMDKINKEIEGINNKLEATNIYKSAIQTKLDNNSRTQKQEINQLTSSASSLLLISNVPNKFSNSVSIVLESGREIVKLKSSIPENLTSGMNEQQKIYFKNFVEDVYYYWSNMAMCFGLLSEGSVGYGYLDNNEIHIDKTDQYYRENVFRNDEIFKTSNYNSSYSKALIEKGNAAYDLFKLIDSDTNFNKTAKNNILKYGLYSVNLIYKEAVEGYQDEYVLKTKQELILKLNQNLK